MGCRIYPAYVNSESLNFSLIVMFNYILWLNGQERFFSLSILFLVLTMHQPKCNHSVLFVLFENSLSFNPNKQTSGELVKIQTFQQIFQETRKAYLNYHTETKLHVRRVLQLFYTLNFFSCTGINMWYVDVLFLSF